MEKQKFKKLILTGITASLLVIVFYGYRKLAVFYDYENLVSKGQPIEGLVQSAEPLKGRYPGRILVRLHYDNYQKEPRTFDEVWEIQKDLPKPGEKIRLYYHDENGFIKASSTHNIDFPKMEMKRS